MKNRIIYLDNCRALCMLWIIGVWHLLGYCEITGWMTSPYARAITNGVLASFTLISGLFLGRKECIDKKDIIVFWKKRLIRIYPLFFISCTSFYLIHLYFGYHYINSSRQYILTLLGLATFVGESPQTIWYISMLIMYYFISPLILSIQRRNIRYGIVVILYLVLIMLKIMGSRVDTKIIVLFPFYFVPLLLSNKILTAFENDQLIFKLIPVSIIGFVIINSSVCYNSASVMFSIISSLLFLCITVSLAKVISRIKLINHILYYFGYASMVAYLFHRQWYGLIQFTFFRSQNAVPLYAAYLIMLPSIIVIAYVVQRIYDRITVK